MLDSGLFGFATKATDGFGHDHIERADGCLQTIRDELKMKPGDRCNVRMRDGEIVIMPKTGDFNDPAGLPGELPAGKDAALEEMDDAIRSCQVPGSDAED